MELRVPRDRVGNFSPEDFDKYQRSERHWFLPSRRCTCMDSQRERLRK
ncbi:transposase [Candidatus Bipolaricaulota bacterium]|nr:transposase [Candidatus Bipolaricaulota bacterium]